MREKEVGKNVERALRCFLVIACLNLPANESQISQAKVAEPTKISISTLQKNYLRVRPIIEPSAEMVCRSHWLEVEKVLKACPEEFSEQDFSDLQIYFPIYFKAGEKYDIPWYLLWIIHQQESDVSRDEYALLGRDGFNIGAMQRAWRVYPDSVAEQAAAFAPDFLREIQTRDPNDLREICFAAWKLDADGKWWSRQSGQTGDEAIHKALGAYCASIYADQRFEIYLALKPILG